MVQQQPPSGRKPLRLVTKFASEYRPTEVKLAARGFPLGATVAVAGEPGEGKTTATTSLAVALSSGKPFATAPEALVPPGRALILSAEEDPATTVVPRLIRSGADLDRIKIIEGVSGPEGLDPVSLKDHVASIEQSVEETGDVRIIIIDPPMSVLGEGVNPDKTVQVRRVIQPLVSSAMRHGILLVLVYHLRKSQKGDASSALNRISNSGAWAQIPRAIWFVGRESPGSDTRLMVPVKYSLGRFPPGLRFKIEGPEDQPGAAVWLPGETKISADELLSQDHGGARERMRAVEFYKAHLADGPQPSRVLAKLAGDEQISTARLQEARKLLGVLARKLPGDRTSGWELRLPEPRLAA
jgi:hypothetical protein